MVGTEHSGAQSRAAIDTPNSIAQADIDGTRFVLAPFSGRVGNAGDLCLEVTSADDTSAGCARPGFVAAHGLTIVTDTPSRIRRIDGYLPKGFTAVTAGAARASARSGFYSLTVPNVTEYATAIGAAGSTRIPMPSPPTP